MTLRYRKFDLVLSPVSPDQCLECRRIFEELSNQIPIFYCGIYSVDGESRLYVHSSNPVTPSRVKSLVEKSGFVVKSVSRCKKFEGVVISEHGEILKAGFPLGKKRRRGENTPSTNNSHNITNNTTNNITNNTTNTNNTNNINVIQICVNPVGQETIDHITPEFIQDLLEKYKSMEGVFKFGDELYAIKENINFRTGMKDGFVRAWSEEGSGPAGWRVMPKSEAFDILMDNIMKKNREAIHSNNQNVSPEDVLKYEESLDDIEEGRGADSNTDSAKSYRRNRNRGMGVISENNNAALKSFEQRKNKKIRVV